MSSSIWVEKFDAKRQQRLRGNTLCAYGHVQTDTRQNSLFAAMVATSGKRNIQIKMARIECYFKKKSVSFSSASSQKDHVVLISWVQKKCEKHSI
jgi:hypothetical protein